MKVAMDGVDMTGVVCILIAIWTVNGVLGIVKRWYKIRVRRQQSRAAEVIYEAVKVQNGCAPMLSSALKEIQARSATVTSLTPDPAGILNSISDIAKKAIDGSRRVNGDGNS